MSEPIVVFITAPDEEEAVRIAGALVGESLAACVNIVRDIRSIYSWRGKIEDEAENLLVVKTDKALFERLCRRVRQLHSYKVPEVIALPVVAGLPEYVSWLEDVTKGSARP
ncbi:MAG: divalent-cation tolerance protein CutA [Nitrospiraceae bacterium]|nr:divalent-cation tolerance protein CutA [Nitrospiraceae bacterium]